MKCIVCGEEAQVYVLIKDVGVAFCGCDYTSTTNLGMRHTSVVVE